MRYKKLKIAAIIILALSCGINAYALEKIQIVPANYDTGSPAKTLSNNVAVSMTSGKQVGYKVDFPNVPSSIKVNLGSYAKSQSTVEVWLDGVESGTLIGTIITEPTTAWTSVDYDLPLNVNVKGEHILYFKCRKGTCDFNGVLITINEAGDIYPLFSEEDVSASMADKNIGYKFSILCDLGILENTGDINVDEFITRREYIRIMSKLYDAVPAPELPVFEDVPVSDTDFAAIGNMHSKGIIKGKSGARLEPDKFITAEEMLRMSIRAMGYTYAENVGEDIFVTASRANLLDGVKLSGSTVRRGEMIDVLYNMLMGTAVEISNTGYSSSTFKEITGVLSVTKNVHVGVGVVADNGFTNIYDVDSQVDIGGLKIGNEYFSQGKTNAANYLGMNCLYFYRDITDNDEKELMAVAPYKKTKYTVLSTKDTEITEIGERKVSYIDEKNKEQEIDISASTSFVFNGKARDKDLSVLIPDISRFRGRLILIDNNNDDVTDVALIESYVTMLFGGVSQTEIYDKFTGQRYPIQDKDEAFIYINGTRVNWEDIPQNAVIDVYQSKNNTGRKNERIIVSTNTVSGIVTGALNDTRAKVVIDGKEYVLHRDIGQQPSLGDGINAFFNTDNEIVYFEKTQQGIELGYIFRVRPIEIEDEPSYMVEMLTSDNSVQKLEFAKSATIDGVRIKNADELVNGKGAFAGAGTIVGSKPVLYKTDADGKLTYFDTIADGALNDQDNLIELLDNVSVNNKSVGLTQVGGNSLVSVFSANKKVITTWSTGEEELASIGTSLTAGNTSNIVCSAYTTNRDSFLTDVVVWYGKTVGNHKSDFVFDKLSERVNEDGEVVKVLSGFTGEAEVEYTINNYVLNTEAENGITYSQLISSLKQGDLLSVGVNARDEVEVIKVILFADGESTNAAGVAASISKTISKESVYERGKSAHGTILGIEEGIIKLEKNVSGVMEVEYIPCANAKIVKVENMGSRVGITNNQGVEQLMVGDHVVICTNTESYSAASVFMYDTITW